jgi:hypothetical protein
MRFQPPEDDALHSVNSYLRFSDEALALRITEKFLSELGRMTMRFRHEMFDVTGVKKLLGEVRSCTDSANSDPRNIVEGKLRNELDGWRNVLIKLDTGVQAYEIRRFTDSVFNSLDSNIFFALARFYRAMPLDTQSRSKFDLVVTRAFEAPRSGAIRKWKFNRLEVASRIRQLFREWDEQGGRSGVVEASETADIAAIDGFIKEAGSLTEFESLVASNIFERFREFKRDLGTSYFHPECVAAAIECNIVLGNVFAEHLSHVNADLHDRISSHYDLAAFMDATTDSSVAMADLFDSHEGENARL